ncbi:MAG TPA: serine/threonine-protein kinase [Solirubrobacteraceae bacterium]|nr:serine/threonine-protein kinase [Solirubrobacteraceae bacterium]
MEKPTMHGSEAPTLRRGATEPTIRRTRRKDGEPPQTPGEAPQTHGEPSLVLERYRLQRRLGAGGFGTVWQAHDERLDREVAVKIVVRERVNAGRFEREAKAAARLQHPNIVTLYEAGADDDGAYLVSELVRGSTLDQLLGQGRLSDRDIVAIGIALCDALQHAHGQDVIHRDVKPSNVLIPKNSASRAKLTDFGVARVLGGDTLTKTGDVVGTMAYMAPEQALGRQAGAPADLYALALVLYEALTGVNPLASGTAAQHARRLGAHLPPLRRQRRELPRELGRALDLALRPKPRERGTIEELHAALTATLSELSDKTGIVGASRLSREKRSEELSYDGDLDAAASVVFAAEAAPASVAPPAPWPERAIAAAAAAGLTNWLATHTLAPAPVAAPVLALLAAVAVLLLPRIGWLITVATLALIAATLSHVPLALMIVIAGALPAALLPRQGTYWPLPAIAPGLAAIGLAGATPALAATAKSAYRRAALGALGYVYIAIIGNQVHIPGRAAASVWIGSPYDMLHHLLLPLVTSGALLPALVWAGAAVTLPYITQPKPGHTALNVVSVITWGALTTGLTSALAQSSTPPSMVLGVLVGAVFALAPTAVAAHRAAGDSAPIVS